MADKASQELQRVYCTKRRFSNVCVL